MFCFLSQDLALNDPQKVVEMAKIYKKESSRPLSNYQKMINQVAGELAVKDPSLLTRRGELLDLSRAEVQQRGYQYVKGKSRSKRFMSPPTETPKPTRLKVSADIRQQRIRALEEDLSNIEKQLHFKNKRLQQAENIKNYKLCEEINEEVQIVTRQKWELTNELKRFHEKERKARWFQRKKKQQAKSSASTVTSDDSDFSLLSPGSSRATPIDTVRDVTSDSDPEHPSDSSSVFRLASL